MFNIRNVGLYIYRDDFTVIRAWALVKSNFPCNNLANTRQKHNKNDIKGMEPPLQLIYLLVSRAMGIISRVNSLVS